jgi:hypothetical protein
MAATVNCRNCDIQISGVTPTANYWSNERWETDGLLLTRFRVTDKELVSSSRVTGCDSSTTKVFGTLCKLMIVVTDAPRVLLDWVIVGQLGFGAGAAGIDLVNRNTTICRVVVTRHLHAILDPNF